MNPESKNGYRHYFNRSIFPRDKLIMYYVQIFKVIFSNLENERLSVRDVVFKSDCEPKKTSNFDSS